MKTRMFHLVPLRFILSATLSLAMGLTMLNGPAAAEQAAMDPVVATVNGQQITARELYAHTVTSGLSREETLEDVINIYLIRGAAATFSIEAPTGTWSREMRADLEYALASVMALDIPPVKVTLVVDHAWRKDAEIETEIMEGRMQITRLREMVANGNTIPQAYAKMNLDGSMWHIGDHEEYPYDVIPEEARDLKPGTLSPLITGNGGIHLFWIYQKKEEKPPAESVHAVLIPRLRDVATIEYATPPEQ